MLRISRSRSFGLTHGQIGLKIDIDQLLGEEFITSYYAAPTPIPIILSKNEMKKNLRLFMLVFVFALANTSNVHGFIIPDHNIGTTPSNVYDSIIDAIRNNPHTSTFVNNIRRINANTPANSAFLLSVNNVHMVLRSRDLYLIGFVDDAGTNFHHFQDVNPASVSFDRHQPYSNVNVARRPTAHNIGFEASYTALERRGNHTRANLRVDRTSILNSLRSIRNFVQRNPGDPQRTNQRDLATGVLDTVVVFIEAARFGDDQLAGRISNALLHHRAFNTTAGTEGLVVNWARYFNGIYNLANTAVSFTASFFDPALGRDDNGRCIANFQQASVLMALLGVQRAGGGSRVARDTSEKRQRAGTCSEFRPLDIMQVGKTYSFKLISDENCPLVRNGNDLIANCHSSGDWLKVEVTSFNGHEFRGRIGPDWYLLQRGSQYGLSNFYRANLQPVRNPLIIRPVGNSGNRFEIFYDARGIDSQYRICGLDWRPDDVLAFHCGDISDIWSFRYH